MHLKRWLTSLALLPFLLLLIFKGGSHVFAGFIGVICLLSLREYFHIVWHKNRYSLTRPMSVWGYVMGVMVVLSAHFLPPSGLLIAASLSLILPGWFCLKHFKADSGIPEMLAFYALGILYIPISLSTFVMIRHTAFGIQWIFLILCVVAAGDVAAFYVGTYWGKHKLCPAVSPGKTKEGALGGLIANLGAGFLLGKILLPELAILQGALSFIAIGAAGQVGDLFESMLKRSAGLKDSGNLLPGHGGLLDRIDALLFATPVAFIFISTLFN